MDRARRRPQLLGTTAVTVSAFERIDPATLPEGTNLYGRVYSGGEALEGVPVSDGLNVVTSDAQGVWSMVSDRASDVMFVTLPRGYEAAADGPVRSSTTCSTPAATATTSH